MVNVIGLGYIGLPTALMFAAHGVEVVGSDFNKNLVEQLQKGHITFEEEGLEQLFNQAVNNGIQFLSDYISTEIYIIAVPSPYDKNTKKIDACYIISAVKDILKVCPKNAIIVIESTISPGTIDKLICPLIESNGFVVGVDIHLAHAPERIIPGNMLYELKSNSRTIGAYNKIIGEKIKNLYASFCEGDIVVTDIRTAEMTKVVENTFRDINIAFANELAKICRSDNMDVYEIIRIANMHPRVNILSPGPGVGGHCISVDPWFLVGDYPGLANIILAARKINDSMPEFVLGRIHDIMKENNIDDISKVGLYGLTYKEDIDDVRESPTLQMLECMKKHLATGINVYDPLVKKDIVQHQFHNFESFLNAVDMVVIMVGHSEIIEQMDKLKGKVLLDTRKVCFFDDVYTL